MEPIPWDNVVWHALTSRQQPFSLRHGTARAYLPAVAPFAGVPDEPSGRDWQDLADLAGPRPVILFRTPVPISREWTQLRVWPCYQMVAPDNTGAPQPRSDVVDLGPADVPEMSELVRLTEPGPFFPETITLGSYIGVRSRGRLVAMAGERIAVTGATEISAVCTHPDERGQGLAEHLMLLLAAGIQARGEAAFLHVVSANTPAVRLYEKLDYRVNRQPTAVIMAAPVTPAVTDLPGSGIPH